MIVDANKLIDVSNAVSNLPDRGVLESTLWVLAPVIKDTSLFVDVVQVKRLKLSTLSELYIFQTLDVNDQSVRLSLCDGLLNLEVGELKHISKT